MPANRHAVAEKGNGTGQAVMESYKHSCPFCGQHIEYTVEYCGQQMSCPSCARPVIFPAVLMDTKSPPLRIKRPEAARVARSFILYDILASLGKFKHWNVVFACFVPFVIVAGLLVGADMVKKNAGNEPAMPAPPPIQVDPNAWQKMTDLARADQLVQEKLGIVTRACGAATTAQRFCAAQHAYYQRQTLDQATYNGVMLQLRADDQAVANTQNALAYAHQSFETAFQNYQKLGGTVDYRGQLPR